MGGTLETIINCPFPCETDVGMRQYTQLRTQGMLYTCTCATTEGVIIMTFFIQTGWLVEFCSR